MKTLEHLRDLNFWKSIWTDFANREVLVRGVTQHERYVEILDYHCTVSIICFALGAVTVWFAPVVAYPAITLGFVKLRTMLVAKEEDFASCEARNKEDNDVQSR